MSSLSRVTKSNKETTKAPGNAVLASTNNVGQPISVVTENEDNRVFQLEFGNDMAITTITRAGDAFFTTDFLDQQNIALVDDIPR